VVLLDARVCHAALPGPITPGGGRVFPQGADQADDDVGDELRGHVRHTRSHSRRASRVLACQVFPAQLTSLAVTAQKGRSSRELAPMRLVCTEAVAIGLSG